MKATMMVDSFKLSPVTQYSDPDYDLIFFDTDGAEVHLGLYERTFKELKEKIESIESDNLRINTPKQTLRDEKNGWNRWSRVKGS